MVPAVAAAAAAVAATVAHRIVAAAGVRAARHCANDGGGSIQKE